MGMSDQVVASHAFDLDFVPCFRDSVVSVPVEDEAVLYEQETGALHRLDPIATVVCTLFDGVSTIRQTVAELAEAFQADPQVITEDVLGLARELGAKGLLQGVEPEAAPVEVDDDGC
jgi:hypothetical protein